MLLKRIFATIFPVLIFFSLEFSFHLDVKYLAFLFPAIIIVLLVFLKFIIAERLLSQAFWYLIVAPVLLLIAIEFFLLILSSEIVKQIIVIVYALLLFVYFDSLFLFFYRSDKYQPHSLENLVSFLNILLFFLVAINLNAVHVFLNLPIWLLSIIMIFLLSIILLEAFWINKFNNNAKYFYLLIINILMLEFYWSFSFLPTNFYVTSIFLTIIFYTIWGIVKARLNDKLNNKLIWRYMVISSILCLCVIFTNSWT